MAFLKTVGKRVARAAGRGAMATGRGAGRAAMSRGGVAAIAAGAFGLGLLNKAAPAARDAAFDVAFDDPDADVAFMGRKMSSRFLLGTAIGGPMGGALRYSAPSDLMTVNPAIPVPTPANLIATGVASTALGIGGVAAGLKYGKGARNKIFGALAGGLVGGSLPPMLGAGTTALALKGHVNRNQKFYNESPYAGRTSGSIANAMNSSGDIVLGMHNARRGY
jgi:hypothetical protein